MDSLRRLFVSMFVLFCMVAGCTGGTVIVPTCETALDPSKVHCLYRPGSSTIVWGDPGASDPEAVVSASQGYVTYTLWVWEDGGFGIPGIDNVTANSTMDVTVQLEGCTEAVTEVTCPPEY